MAPRSPRHPLFVVPGAVVATAVTLFLLSHLLGGLHTS